MQCCVEGMASEGGCVKDAKKSLRHSRSQSPAVSSVKFHSVRDLHRASIRGQSARQGQRIHIPWKLSLFCLATLALQEDKYPIPSRHPVYIFHLPSSIPRRRAHRPIATPSQMRTRPASTLLDIHVPTNYPFTERPA